MPALFISGFSRVHPDALHELRPMLKQAVAEFGDGVLQLEAWQVDVRFLTEVAPDPDATIFLISEGLFRNPGNGKRQRTAAMRQGLATILAPMLRTFANEHDLDHCLVEVLVKDFDHETCGFAALPGKKAA